MKVKFTVLAASATLVAGAVAFWLARRDPAPPAEESPSAASARPAPLAEAKAAPERRAKPKPAAKKREVKAAKAASSGPYPEAVARFLVENAVSANDYRQLSLLRDKLDRIDDPELRLRLLEGLAWFDETAVADALPFLLDSDERVSAAAGEVVANQIASVTRASQREKLYTAALKLMPADLADRDILLAALENDKKSVVIRVLRDSADMERTDPELWEKLKEVYETACGRPYRGHIDALSHYDIREDRD